MDQAVPTQVYYSRAHCTELGVTIPSAMGLGLHQSTSPREPEATTNLSLMELDNIYMVQ